MGADEWHDPHGLVPEAFKNTFSEHDSVRDALRHAERLPSSTPPEDRAGACPQCGSVGISPIGTGQGDGSANDWKCNECEHRFKEPDKPDMTRYDSTTHTRFNFVTEDELADPDDRDESPIFATLDAETRTALAIVLYRPWTDAGPSYREMAPLFPHTHYWIGKRVRAWKNGDYRELVPDPTAEPEPITVDASSDTGAVATDGGRRSRWDAYGS
jgi:hypothetical protein